MRKYFAYIRVSTVKQGEHGSSLQEQRDAIKIFAARSELHIVDWFEERETAAKIGRHEFTRMLVALKTGTASGIIFHKIDRSARNLKDWSAIQDLADQGIDIRFSQESVNLSSNEGKLTGDFLAVISSHYIRNLREEVKKGMRGRLKQGLYPLAAPIGYLDQGGGKRKIPDPIRGPLVTEAFELYASGQYTLRALREELYQRGLRNRLGDKVEVNTLAKVLRNPFYTGIIYMRRSGETYAGLHTPLIAPSTFRQVQDRLDGKTSAKIIRHDFLFRRMVACAHCRYHLIGERQKGHVYYRCHTAHCLTRGLREEVVEEVVRSRLAPLYLSEDDTSELRSLARSFEDNWEAHREDIMKSMALRRQAVENRLQRLADAYLDSIFDRQMFEEKKLALIMELKDLEQQQNELLIGQRTIADNLESYLEPIKGIQLSHDSGTTSEKREMLESLTSNLEANGKNVVVNLRSPFQEAANLALVSTGGPVRDRPRTRAKKLFKLLVKHFSMQAEEQRRQESLAA